MCLDLEVQMRSDQSPNVSPASISPVLDDIDFKAGEPSQLGGSGWRHACAGLVFAAAFTCVAQDGHSTAAPAVKPGTAPQVQATSSANAKPQADPPAGPQAGESSPHLQSSADKQQRNQISVDSTQLLAMAVDLKAEVDKTNKDTLSINVIRKADAIEKLAKTVKEKIKQGSGPG
jgi:hypothetical protein